MAFARSLKELYELPSSPNLIWLIKSKRVSWAGRVAHIGDRRGAQGYGGEA
jgi:hypothetical protein